MCLLAGRSWCLPCHARATGAESGAVFVTPARSAAGAGARADYPGGVATFSSVTRQHILQAIAEHDSRGSENFLGVYGFEASGGPTIVHEGTSYDCAAVIGVAHRYATGRTALAEEFDDGAIKVVRNRGFDVVEPGAARAPRRAPAPKRTAAAKPASTRRPAEPERPTAMCPTCFMTLPATGICDNCA